MIWAPAFAGVSGTCKPRGAQIPVAAAVDARNLTPNGVGWRMTIQTSEKAVAMPRIALAAPVAVLTGLYILAAVLHMADEIREGERFAFAPLNRTAQELIRAGGLERLVMSQRTRVQESFA